mmetsp:Transcript_9793/g.12212  ORF Transcript_9793/g.12212 Transcript_9793/m.12212 type:complete len:208 (+) Transcript_9793:45-668(+)
MAKKGGNLLISKEVEDKWKAIINPKKVTINWFLAEFIRGKKKHKLVMFKSGKKGFSELISVLGPINNKALFGSLRITLNDKDGKAYTKFIYLRYLGSKVSVMVKGQLTPCLGSIDDVFGIKHIQYDIDEDLNSFNKQNIAKQFDRVSENIVSVDYYDFGDNEPYKLQAEQLVASIKPLKVVKGGAIKNNNNNNDNNNATNDDEKVND